MVKRNLFLLALFACMLPFAMQAQTKGAPAPAPKRDLTGIWTPVRVLDGIQAAKEAGFTRIKLNAVILKGRNEDEVLDLVSFARREQLDISFIEEMPLGDVSDHSRAETFYSSDDVQALIETRYPLTPTTESTMGPRSSGSM